MPTSIWYSDGPAAPRVSPREALDAAGVGESGAIRLTLGWMVERLGWIESLGADPEFQARTVVAGFALSEAVNTGRVSALPVRLSAVPALIANDPPDVAVVSGVRRGAGYAFTTSVGWADVLARHARTVVVEVDENAPDLGAPGIEGNIVAVLSRPEGPTAPPANARPADDTDRTIGALVGSVLPDDPTLQFGTGGISEGIASSLDRPVRIWTGLVTEAVAGLHSRGLLVGAAVTAYAWGDESVRALADVGALDLRSCTYTHDLTYVSAIPRFVSCNTALQLGLDGSVNIERIGRRVIAPVGGHPDFCVAAARSVGGRSIIAMRSTTAKGASTIVPRVDVVSTSRSDVQMVVTEHGIADLRYADDSERARLLIGIAAPEHRDALRLQHEEARR
jgi:acyl-CoA hydrolase